MTKGKTHHPQAYGDEAYWDNRYTNDAGAFDWYQRYSGLSPLINKYVLKTWHILMAGCGNAVISEDMVNDGYQDIVNVDISTVVIDVMQKKYKDVPQLSYMRLDVREMKMFKDATFDAVIDKGMFDSLMVVASSHATSKLAAFTTISYIDDKYKYQNNDSVQQFHMQCGASAPYSAARMLEEVRRILKPGGVYMLITYGDPRVRLLHLKSPEINWNILLHVIPRPGSKRAAESSSRVLTDPVLLSEDGTLGPQFSLEDPDLHYVYVCTKDKQDGVKKGSPADKKKPPAK